MKTIFPKERLYEDILHIENLANLREYLADFSDGFVLGYVAGKYGLKRFRNNEKEVVKACQKYDKTNDLALCDTSMEVLADLRIIKKLK